MLLPLHIALTQVSCVLSNTIIINSYILNDKQTTHRL